MTRPKIILSDTYNKRLSEIEDFVFKFSENNYSAVEKFLEEHDRTLKFFSHDLGHRKIDASRLRSPIPL